MSNSKTKILHITFNMGIGGTEQVIRQIIENSDAEKFCHEILCIDGTVGSLGLALKEKGIYIESIKRQPGVDFKLQRFIRRLIKQRNIDVVHCHQYTPYFYGVLSALWTKARVIFTEHGRFYPDRHNPKRRIINPLLVYATDYITAISKSTAEAVAKYEYMPRQKIRTIYNGITDLKVQERDRLDLLKELGLSDDYRYIGTISRLEPIKNQVMMINAFNAVKQKIPDVKLIIIGDGAKMQDLQALSKNLGLEHDIIFTGFLDDPQRFIVLFEIFLLSSFSEGTSMTLLEAMSLSKSCVVTDVGGNPEIVKDGETGILVPSDDAELFATAMMRLLADKSMQQSYGKEARERFIKRYTVSKMVDQYQMLYLK